MQQLAMCSAELPISKTGTQSTVLWWMSISAMLIIFRSIGHVHRVNLQYPTLAVMTKRYKHAVDRKTAFEKQQQRRHQQQQKAKKKTIQKCEAFAFLEHWLLFITLQPIANVNDHSNAFGFFSLHFLDFFAHFVNVLAYCERLYM